MKMVIIAVFIHAHLSSYICTQMYAMSACKLYTIPLHYLALNCGHHHQHSQPVPHHHHLPQ